jgi:hypothetical protein
MGVDVSYERGTPVKLRAKVRPQCIKIPTPLSAFTSMRAATFATNRGTSLKRNSAPLGPYRRTKHKALWWPLGGVAVSCERGTHTCAGQHHHSFVRRFVHNASCFLPPFQNLQASATFATSSRDAITCSNAHTLGIQPRVG